MHIEQWDIDKPQPYPKNARKWNERAVEKVAASIRLFGWRQPIVVDSAGVIVIGHLRMAAAKSLGMKQVPVHVAFDLTPEQIRGLRLADNRTHDEAVWDDELLKIEFGELQALNFDLAATGFDLGEIDPQGKPLTVSLADRFLIPPFSVLDARQGYWQERKRAWLALGIQSELGRGGAPGGSPRPAALLTDSGITQRGDGAC